MEKRPGKLMPSIWGGLLIGFISGVPFLAWLNCSCCIGVMAGGILAAYLYRNDLDPGQPMEMSDGAALGLLSGIFGAVIGAILNTFWGSMSVNFIYKMSQNINSPQLNNWLNQINPIMLERGLFIFKFLSDFVIFCIFGLIGGLIGVSIFGKAKESAKAA
ncbi:MAG: hypothetical protein GXO75_07705 [Calditrichaeota bacterium]|nr:hypothetical protein [Calditrichota bacterium]